MDPLFAAIEAGGTKWRCALGKADGNIVAETSFAIGHPDDTLQKAIAALKRMERERGKVSAIGIGTFGPIALDCANPSYGQFLNTPKQSWAGFNLLDPLKNVFGADLPICLETDVNTAVLAEARLGAGLKFKNLAYITVGTGIGGGIMIDGELLRGRMHPEIGHIPVHESPLEPIPQFSACPFHAHCAEGKASGTAMRARWNTDPSDLSEEAWAIEAFYLAQLAVCVTASHSVDRIIFGGGVMKKAGLIERVRNEFQRQAGGYWQLPGIDDYLKLTQLNDRAGLIGGLLLASAQLL